MTTKLAEDIWNIDLPGTNAYVVEDGDTTTLIDGGFPWQADRVADALQVAAGGAAAVDRILVTHYDLDHVGSLGGIDGLDAPVYAGEPDAAHVAGTAKPSARTKKGLMQRLMNWRYSPPAGPVSTIADGDTIGGFECYHTPGHTSGHMVYIHEEASLALLGDLVRSTDGGFKAAPWFMSDDTAAIRRSIRDLADRAPAFEIGAPGHGAPVVEHGAEKLRQCAAGLD